MKCHRNRKNKAWFFRMWANSSGSRILGRKSVRMILVHPLFKDMGINGRPRCWRGD